MGSGVVVKIFISIVVIAVILSCAIVLGIDLPKWFPFGTEKALAEWEEKIFKGKVVYLVKGTDLDGYLAAYSKEAASGMFYRVQFDPKDKPMVSWKWKVLKFPSKTNAGAVGAREIDDYPTRFYVIFPGCLFPFTKTLEYVWDKNLPEGTVLTSPYHQNIKIIVVESGEENLGRWVFEEQNVGDDFRRIFGGEPGKVGAIALMTDTDDTVSVAEAHYDEIKVGYSKNE